jgi:EpsD family peptidyl-prolyl cis-trans isomerase
MVTSSRMRALMLLSAAALALAACGDKKADAPTGQVVATVNGEDVTIHELNAEMEGVQLPPNVPRKLAEQQVLQNIITRKLLIDVAKEKKIDQNPKFLIEQRRTGEQLLVQALGKDITSKIPPVTREETEKYIRDYPNLFSERKILVLDQIQFLRPKNVEQLQLAGAKTMADVERLLTSNSIEYRRQPATLDALSANPDFVNEVVKVVRKNPDEVFMFANQPQGAPAPVILINKVTELRVVPFTGERAKTFAQNFLQNIKVQGTLQQEIVKIRDAAKSKIVYGAGYAPPPPPKAAAKKPVAGAIAAAPLAAPAAAAK